MRGGALNTQVGTLHTPYINSIPQYVLEGQDIDTNSHLSDNEQ